MSLINDTIFCSISIECLKNTNVWKQNEDENGKVPSHILRGMLDLVGFDLNKTHKKERAFHTLTGVTIRDVKNPCYGYETVVFTGKLKSNVPWSNVFKDHDIVTPEVLNMKNINIDNLKKIKLENHGLDVNTWKKIGSKK